MEKKEVSMCSVRLATKRDLLDLKTFLQGLLPDTCDIYESLVSAIMIPNMDIRFYYASRSDGKYGAIFSLMAEECVDETQTVRKIWVTCQWSQDDHCLLSIYHYIDGVDWKKDFFDMYGQGYQLPDVIKTFLSTHGVVFKTWPMDRYILDDARSIQIEMTPEVYVKSLERYHAPLVYEHWPYKSCTTVDYVANEIDRLPSAGVFLKDGDRLVSWVMEHPPSGTSRLHTLEQYRRCGYGRLAVLYFSKRSAQAGRQPFANIVVGNESSVHLFRSMGFRFWGGVQTTGLFPGVVL